MDTNRYYQALATFNEAANQMRLALRAFHSLRAFRGDPSYEIDLEVLRTEVSERMMDAIGDQETKNATVAVRRQARYREHLRRSDTVLQERLGKSPNREQSGHEHPAVSLRSGGTQDTRKKPVKKHRSSLARQKASEV